ncbi:MAG: carboxypeptidase-like regulatory domain-containing protein, partial [Acidobacteria bacterium]|nr:carboxypeptidase-like regulatory domain-containing protein [Acidobacteriota bacterium]
ANTPNDGSETVVIPRIGTSWARIMVEAAGNIFLDISDTNFNILGPTVASVGGRTLDQLGRGIKEAVVTLTSPDGGVRTAVTNLDGFYVFDDVPLGEVYVIRASQKHYRFAPESIEYTHVGQSSNQNFTGVKR